MHAEKCREAVFVRVGRSKLGNTLVVFHCRAHMLSRCAHASTVAALPLVQDPAKDIRAKCNELNRMCTDSGKELQERMLQLPQGVTGAAATGSPLFEGIPGILRSAQCSVGLHMAGSSTSGGFSTPAELPRLRQAPHPEPVHVTQVAPTPTHRTTHMPEPYKCLQGCLFSNLFSNLDIAKGALPCLGFCDAVIAITSTSQQIAARVDSYSFRSRPHRAGSLQARPPRGSLQPVDAGSIPCSTVLAEALPAVPRVVPEVPALRTSAGPHRVPVSRAAPSAARISCIPCG